ncbi:MAG: O-antigen ligase family protein [Deltaproteobacteria bacterium]|nr:O-antigen ligase family protein [Deltaproteobacteria bacterium]
MPILSFDLLLTGWWNFLKTTENLPWFPVLSALLTTQVCCTFLFVTLAQKDAKRFVYHSFASISAGLLLSLIFGILDYYNFFDLRYIRDLDKFTNPDDVQFRLQSFFGHSGWYAEYVVLAASTLVSLLSLPWHNKLNNLILVLSLLLAQLILILTFQRGSWITFPVVLLSMILLFQIDSKPKQGIRIQTFIRAGVLLILITLLPIISLYGALKSTFVNPDHRVDFSSYVARFKAIDNSSDRSQFMKAALWLTKENPFLGHGADSFAFKFHDTFNRRTSKFYKFFDLPLHGTAHSLYLQILSGKGIIGLICFISLLAVIIFKLAQQVSVSCLQGDNFEKRTSIALFSFFLSFSLYGFVQELFYIHNLEFLFFAVLSLLFLLPKAQFLVNAKTKLIILSVIGGGLFGHIIFINFFASASSADNFYSYGCYSAEKQGGRAFARWCNPTSRQRFRVLQRNAQCLARVKFRTHFFQPGQQTAYMQIVEQGRVVYQQLVYPGRTYRTVVTLAKVKENQNCPSSALLEVKLNSYFIPRSVFGKGDDYRVLGVQVFN